MLVSMLILIRTLYYIAVIQYFIMRTMSYTIYRTLRDMSVSVYVYVQFSLLVIRYWVTVLYLLYIMYHIYHVSGDSSVSIYAETYSVFSTSYKILRYCLIHTIASVLDIRRIT